VGEFFWGLVLGAILGVVAERLLGHPLDRFIINPARDVINRRSAARTAQRVRVGGELIDLANGSIFVLQYAPVGFDWANLQASKATSDPLSQGHHADSLLQRAGVSWSQVEQANHVEVQRIESDPRMWNGNALAIVAAYVGRDSLYEEPTLDLRLAVRDYAACRSIQGLWLSIPAQQRKKLLEGEALREVHPSISSGFGLNLTVETADGKLLVTRRGAHTVAWAGLLHTSMNEGLNTADLLPGAAIDLRGAFERGLREELGIRLESQHRDCLVVHSLVLDVDRYEWALLAHLNLRQAGITSGSIRAMRNTGMAPDDWEASEVFFTDFTREGVLELISDQSNWIPHGLVNVALSYIYRDPSSASRIVQALTSGE